MHTIIYKNLLLVTSSLALEDEKDPQCACYDPQFPNLCYCDNFGYQVRRWFIFSKNSFSLLGCNLEIDLPEQVMQRHFGQNSGFKPVSAETEIRVFWPKLFEFSRLYIFCHYILSGGKTEKLQVDFCESGAKYSKNIHILAIFCWKRWETFC